MQIETIQTDRYQPTSLRKGRKEALEKDLNDAYTLFSSRYSDPKNLTIKDLLPFWSSSNMVSIPLLRCQEQDEQQYYQVIYRILIHDYFLKDNEIKKLFSIFHIYFFAYSVDSNYQRNSRPIHVTAHFVTQLVAFLKENKEFNKSLFMKIVKKIKELFVYSIKIGLRDPLIKKNGETFIRYPQTIKKLSKNNFSPAIEQIEQTIPSLEDAIKGYQTSKERYLSDLPQKQAQYIRRQFSFDKNIAFRLNQNIKRYKAEFEDEESDKEGDNIMDVQ